MRSAISVMLALFLACAAAGPYGRSAARAEDGDERGSPAVTPPAVDLALTPASRHPEIPWDRLDGTAYVQVRDVVSGALVSREVRDIAFRSRRPVFEFLLDHPDFAADVARTLREGKYRVRRLGDGWEADDGHGARGHLKVVFADGGRRLFYLEGRYDPPLLPSLTGRLVLLLDAEHLEGPDGITYCEMRVAGHLRLDSVVAEVLASVAKGFSEAQVDKKVRRFFRHVAVVSRRAYDDPEGLADELDRRADLSTARVAEFRQVLLAHVPPAWSQTQDFRLIDGDPLSTDVH